MGDQRRALRARPASHSDVELRLAVLVSQRLAMGRVSRRVGCVRYAWSHTALVARAHWRTDTRVRARQYGLHRLPDDRSVARTRRRKARAGCRSARMFPRASHRRHDRRGALLGQECEREGCYAQSSDVPAVRLARRGHRRWIDRRLAAARRCHLRSSRRDSRTDRAVLGRPAVCSFSTDRQRQSCSRSVGSSRSHRW